MGSTFSSIFGGGVGSMGTPQAGQYDPFQAYRAQYAAPTQAMMDQTTTAANTASATGVANAATQQGLAGGYNTAMQATTAPSAAISGQMSSLAQDPSAFFNSQAGQAYMGQVQQGQQRQSAATGMMASGNEQIALQQSMMAGAQGYAGNQMGMLNQSLQGANQTAGLQQSALSGGLNAQTAGLQAGTQAGQSSLTNYNSLMGNLMQLSGASQNAAQGYQAATGAYAQNTNQQRANFFGK